MGCMSSKPTPTRGVAPPCRLGTPTRTSRLARSKTRLDRYADRRVVERLLETRFGPQIVTEQGRDVLLWLVESRDEVVQITAPRQLTESEITGIQQHAARRRISRIERLPRWAEDVVW